MNLLGPVQPLVYHRVCSDRERFASTYVVSASDFRRQMEYLLKHGYGTTTLDAVLREQPAENAKARILLTFDDGYRDNYTNAFPVLKEFGMNAVVFLVADMTRRTNWWDVPLGVPEAPLLQEEQIREMAANGIEFGSHTLNHSSLPGLDDSALLREIKGSRDAIATMTGQVVRALSYPYSHVNDRVKQAVRAAGYSCAFAVNGGPFLASRDLWEIRRVNVTANAGGMSFGVKLSGVEKLGLWAWSSARALLRPGFEIRRGF